MNQTIQEWFPEGEDLLPSKINLLSFPVSLVRGLWCFCKRSVSCYLMSLYYSISKLRSHVSLGLWQKCPSDSSNF